MVQVRRLRPLRPGHQSALIADHLGRLTGWPVDRHGLRRVKRTQPLRGMNPAHRARAVRGAFALAAGHGFGGRRVLLIDDVHTSGASAASTRGSQFAHQRPMSAAFSALSAVNSFFDDRIRYAEDQETWGVPDYWASPLEMLQKGAGDCEDYAIGKYFSLIAAGVAPAKMRLVYVRAQLGGAVQAHMVLAYYADPQAEPLILDNLISEIRPASRRPDLTPVFSFNAEGLWQGVSGSSAGDPSARLSRWRDVLAKAKAEGWW